MFSKILVVVIWVLQIVTAGDFEAEVREKFQHVKEQCVTESGVNHDLIDNVNDGSFTEDQKLKCYMKCLFEKFGKFNDDGTINEDSILALIPEEYRDTYFDMVMKCTKILGSDLCDTSYKTHVCYHKAYPELHFIL